MAAEEKKRMNDVVKEANQENMAHLEEASKRESKALLSGLSQAVNNSVSTKLDVAIKREVKKLGTDIAKQANQTIEKHISQDNQMRTAKCDQSLRDAISKLPHSKTSMDQLGQGKQDKIFVSRAIILNHKIGRKANLLII